METVHDRLQRKLAEIQLKKSEAEFRAFLEAIPGLALESLYPPEVLFDTESVFWTLFAHTSVPDSCISLLESGADKAHWLREMLTRFGIAQHYYLAISEWGKVGWASIRIPADTEWLSELWRHPIVQDIILVDQSKTNCMGLWKEEMEACEERAFFRSL